MAPAAIIATGDVDPATAPDTWTTSTWANIGLTGVGSVTVDNDSDLFSGNAYLGVNSGSTGVVTVSGAGSTWTNSQYIYVGAGGDGTLEITNGGVVGTKHTRMAYYGGSTGLVTVSGPGSTLTNSSNLYIGRIGDGTLNITDDGLVEVSADTHVVVNAGSGGAINFSKGTLTTDGFLGAADDLSGEGTINTHGLVSNVDLIFDATHDLTQILTLNGSGLNITVNLDVDGSGSMGAGYTGNGSMHISDSLAVQSTQGYIGYYSGSIGVVTVSGAGATWANSHDLNVGLSGAGTLEITNGGTVSNVDGDIGYSPGSTGAVTVSGAGATWTNSRDLNVGMFGDGTLEITNGGAVSNRMSNIGQGNDSTGAVTVTGVEATWTNSENLYVGRGGFGTLDIINGGGVSSTDGYIGSYSGSTGAVTVQDAGSYWTNSDSLYIGGSNASSGGTGELTVGNGGTVSVAGTLKLWSGGTLNIHGGSVSTGTLEMDGGTVNFTAGSLSCTESLLVDPGEFLGPDLTLEMPMSLSVGGTTTVGGAATLTLNGGSLSTGSLVRYGVLAFNSGTFNLTDDNLTIGAGGLFGQTIEVPGGKTINVTNTAAVSPTGHLLVTGGNFGAGDLVNTGLVELDRATARIGGTALTNQGVLTGGGRIGAVLNNTVAGHVQIGAGRRMIFTSAGNSNAGTIDVIGGEAQFIGDLANEASTGLITGRDATLRFTGGLSNAGSVALSFGTSDVFGDISNEATGRIVLSGGGNATFYDGVVNNGEVQVSAGSTAVYFGDVTGSGTFSGTGTNYFEGDFHPGSSPAEVSFGGDVVFGPLAGLQMELGGMVGGDEYDQLNVAGDLTLGGTLQVVLIDGFAPGVGDTFDILDFDDLNGTEFGEIELPELVGRKAWDTSNLYTTGLLVVAAMMEGDTDGDWDVDVTDYAAFVGAFGGDGDWRTDFNADGRVDLTDFVMLRANFGFGVPVSAPEYGTTVPEPATLSLLALGGLVVLRRRKK
jgi:fibronectin-binding autotransporter adhesin